MCNFDDLDAFYDFAGYGRMDELLDEIYCDCPICTGRDEEEEEDLRLLTLTNHLPDDFCENCGRSHDLCDCFTIEPELPKQRKGRQL